MKLLKITNVKSFMNKLLIENAFDSFLISEAVVKTANSFVIDGHINKDFYSEAELSDLASEAGLDGRIFSEKLSRWTKIKPFAFSVIKGNKTPLYFKMSFYLAGENIDKFLSSIETSLKPGDIDGLSLIVKYQDSELTVTSNVSLNIFTLDKSLEKDWDEMVQKFLRSQELDFEVM